MPRRLSENQESFDLLLDTICNVFGGIILIALLIALLTGQKSQDLQQEKEDRLEQVRQRGRAAQLRSDIHRLEQDVDDARRQLELAMPDQQVQRLQRRSELTRQLRLAQQRLERLQSPPPSQAQDRELRQQSQRLEQRIETARDRLRQARERLEAQRQTQRVATRLPRKRRTDKKQVFLLLEGGRGYVVDDPRDCTKQRLANFGLRYEPKPSGGFDLSLGEPAGPRLRRMLREHQPGNHFFDIAARPDSAEAFMALRNAVSAAGYRYNVHFLPQEKPLILYPTTTVTAQ